MCAAAVTEVPVKAAVDLLNEEAEVYFKEPPIPRNNNPLTWWRNNQTRMPTLVLVVRAYLAIPVTQAE